MSVGVVSVVMASTVQRVDYFEQALTSVLKQGAVLREAVVVLDGANCEASAHVFALFGSDVRVRIVWSRKRRGLARCLNIAVRISRGEYVARMDDDDICLPGRLESQVEVLRTQSVDVVGSDALVIDSTGLQTGQVIKSVRHQLKSTTYDLYFGNAFIHPSVLMRRSWARANKYDVTWGRGQDRELWVRSSGHSSFYNIAEPLLLYRRTDRVKRVQFENLDNVDRLILKNRDALGKTHWLFLLLNSIRRYKYRILSLVGSRAE